MDQFNVPVEEVPENTTHIIVGACILQVNGLAPHEKIQNIRGDNWPDPPFNLGYVTYAYIENAESASTTARRLGAKLETHEVRVDSNRVAHLIYHAEGQHNEIRARQTIPCLKVFVTVGRNRSLSGFKWLQLVYMPEDIADNHFLQQSLLNSAGTNLLTQTQSEPSSSGERPN
ncbi:hypothetical protein AB1Y20_017386 [Prymnesium parvum]|uniref:Gamma-glutamylcyclotransferase n=1 Tax=Prymnesium parvum TaxID=97485 RepID=A0AB34JKB6_PRYPA|mmetsp:Transcript_15034/g.35854  ORF Transcript_15034/g.35854 Transcript_15034/m.35854 type:complete len:173 (-) Transcript_15034:446-964(-)